MVRVDYLYSDYIHVENGIVVIFKLNTPLSYNLHIVFKFTLKGNILDCRMKRLIEEEKLFHEMFILS